MRVRCPIMRKWRFAAGADNETALVIRQNIAVLDEKEGRFCEGAGTV